MKEFNILYKEYLLLFNRSNNLEIEFEKNILRTRTGEQIKNFEKLTKVIKKTTEIFEIESNNGKNGYAFEFCELLSSSIKNNDWAKYQLTLQLSPPKITEGISGFICCSIEDIILKKSLSTQFENGTVEWNKGSFLEELVKMLDVNIGKERIIDTLTFVLEEMDAEDLDNYHLRNISLTTLNYINKQSSKTNK